MHDGKREMQALTPFRYMNDENSHPAVVIGIDEIKAADSPYCWVDESGRNDAEKNTATYKTFNRHESDSPSETNVYHYTYANSKNGNGHPQGLP